jgi:GNAT superfamily N-acetyltransferase
MGNRPVRAEILIRKVVREDVPALTDLAEQLGYPTRPGEIAERLDHLMEQINHQVFVAQAPGGEVVGWIHVVGAYHLVLEPSAELGGLVVRGGWRNQGTGRLLLERAEEWARAWGYELMLVNSNTARQGVPGFYEHMGYELVKIQNVFYKSLKQVWRI